MTTKELAKKIFFIEILQGLALTLKHLFLPAVTRQYPAEKREPFPGSKGLHALAKDDTGRMKCVGCGLCAAMCPSQCIHIYTSEGEDNKKIVDRYEVDVLRCVFCAFVLRHVLMALLFLRSIMNIRITTGRLFIIQRKGFWRTGINT
ncbi:MAG TPA: NADH-quinone oxidoreductase subunit I [Thermodesulfovibrionia bacterium]|nr:NADH-quinone oxidoreductase subunit I [Thermodesulfovibrionia bacterium]